MMNLWNIAKGAFYASHVILQPSKGIMSLIKVGDLISETKAFQIALERVKEDGDARALIEERYTKGFLTLDELKTYPKNSLGYLMFKQIDDEGLDVYPLIDMSQFSEKEYLRERRREIHDVLHVVLGYDTSLIGEASLNTFLASQSGMPVCLMIPAGVMLKYIFQEPDQVKPLMDSLFEAWKWGKASRSPFGIRWEEYLKQDVDSLRELLKPSLQKASVA